MNDDSFFARAAELERRGEPFATATVVRIERPTSGKPGDRAIVTAAGRLHGWVGGSCARPLVIQEALGALRDGRSRLVRLSSSPPEMGEREGLTDLSMTCFSGGTMEIFIEPHHPSPVLFVVGSSPVARTLARLGEVLGFRIVAVEAGGEGEEAETAAHEVVSLDDLEERVTAASCVVVTSHGDHDEIAVEAALRAGPAYLGLVASARRAGAIRKYLKVRGFGDEELAALRSPAGLDIGARRPEEIALSILAEIVQARREAAERAAERGAEEAADAAAAESGEAAAIDPVCGMTVERLGARYTLEHGGATVYFCCAGCRDRFAADPESYRAAS